MIYKTLRRKLNIEQEDPHKKQEVNLGAQEGYLVPAPLVAAFVLLLEVLEVVDVNMSK
jgi:hypothetical protein